MAKKAKQKIERHDEYAKYRENLNLPEGIYLLKCSVFSDNFEVIDKRDILYLKDPAELSEFEKKYDLISFVGNACSNTIVNPRLLKRRNNIGIGDYVEIPNV